MFNAKHFLRQNMSNIIIQSKNLIKTLLRFFLKLESNAYLRGLVLEFDESVNSVRVELKYFEEVDLLWNMKRE